HQWVALLQQAMTRLNGAQPCGLLSLHTALQNSFMLLWEVKGAVVDGVMAVTADNQRLASQCAHLFHPRGLVAASCPAPLHIDQLVDVMHFAVLMRTTQFAGIRLQPTDKISAHIDPTFDGDAVLDRGRT